MNAESKDYRVRAIRCEYTAEDDAVYEALKRTTAHLDRAWQKLDKAKTIAIKFNQDYRPDDTPVFDGMRVQLVSDKVATAVIRLLRERTSAELRFVDTTVFHRDGSPDPVDSTHLAPVMAKMGVPYANADIPPFRLCKVPGGGQMFEQYMMSRSVVDADALVDVQRMKNHVFMGVTLTLKNLFGLVPMAEPEGRARQYFHHLVRMPYMLADIGRIMNPALSIIDGLIAQAGSEWWSAEGKVRTTNVLIAGDHPVATDAVGTHLMGLDPTSDWLTEPFHRDRNALLVAAEGGFGTVDLDQIDWTSEVSPQPKGTFYAQQTDELDRVISWRRTTCEQALYYRDHMKELTDRYPGEYILLQENEVKWHSESSYLRESRRLLSGDKPEQAMFLKYVDPEEAEGEHFEVYERGLKDIKAKGL